MKSSCGAHLSTPNSTAPGSRGPKGEDHRGGHICCSALCKVLISTKKPHQIWSNKQSCTWCKVHHYQHDVVRSWTRRSSWVSSNSRYSILRKLISLLLMYGWKAKKNHRRGTRCWMVKRGLTERSCEIHRASGSSTEGTQRGTWRGTMSSEPTSTHGLHL